jgi:hypothetical protein
MATVCVFVFCPIGRVFHITTVKAVHPLTFRSMPASGWPGPRLPASASRTQPSFPELRPSQSIESALLKSLLPTFFERRKFWNVWRRVPVQ